MTAPKASNSTKMWNAADVMDAVMLRGRFVGHRYPPHTHETHCLAVITGGNLNVAVGGERRVSRRWDVLVIDAEEVHEGVAAGDGEWKMRVANFQPTALARYCERLGLPKRDRFEVKSPFICDPVLSQHLYGISWCSENEDDQLKRSETLASAIADLCAYHAVRPIGPPVVRRETALVTSVKNRLRDRVTLLTLARDVGVTPFVLLRAFVREAGLSPHAF